MRLIGVGRLLPWIAVFSGLTVCSIAPAQTLVDCTGAITTDYKTITAALAATATTGANIQVVAGPCTETVTITGRYNLNLGAPSGKTIVLNGSINIQDSANVYIYGFNVTNTAGNGIAATDSRAVTLDTFTSSGNKNDGLFVNKFSDVSVFGPSTFQSNGLYGIDVEEQSGLDIETSTGALNASNNGAAGLFAYHGSGIAVAGNLTAENNGTGPKGHGGGINIRQGSSLQLNDCTGNNMIQGNIGLGINVFGASVSNVASCGAGYKNLIENNGAYGIQIALSSTVVVNNETQISGHPQAGILVDAGASLYVNGAAVISTNGTPADINTGGVIATNGSGVEIDGAQVNSNLGWGFAASLNSALSLSGNTASGNGLGIIGCDSSSYASEDFPPNAGGIYCTTPSIPVVQPQKPLLGSAPRPAALKLSETEPPDPAALAEKVRQARAAFRKAMRTTAGRPN